MVIIVLGFVTLLLALVVGGLVFFFRRPLPQIQGTVRVPGLREQVEVIRDRWGVPHVYAESEEDLFFAQGYVHAQDRLWQMEFQRRMGSGRLSEILGDITLEIDRFLRVVGLKRAAEAEWEWLDERMRRVLEAYAAGVNAYLQEGRLPVEFSLLRFQPEPWQPVDSLYWAKMMSWNLSRNWDSELVRARLAAKLGTDRAVDLEPLFPADNPPIVPGVGIPEGREPPPNGWRSEALRDALRLVEDLFSPGPSVTPSEGPSEPSALDQGQIPGPVAGGSNQWVVTGPRSASGQPLLANDTHLAIMMPAGFYEIHLVGGDYNVIGVSLPGIPGVIVGHNEHCAWGMTTAWQDVQDLYVERLNPADPHQYGVQGKWLDAQVVQEEIRVKGRDDPLVQEVVITRHGPLIGEVVGEERPLALRWVALEPSPLLHSMLRYNRARNWEEFRAALGDWSAPPHNFVYADVQGNIGYLQAGWVPIRAKGYGLAPVPGWTGEYEWQGYLPLDELPQAYNPEDNWLATANHQVVDDRYPHFISGDWENPCRARRVVDLVTARMGLTADDFAAFQLDTYSAQAERFVRHLVALQPEGDRERRALDYLANWNYRLDTDSVAASLYQTCRLRALHIVFDGHLGELAESHIGLDPITPLPGTGPYHGRSIVRLLDLLDGQGDDLWLHDPATGRPRSRPELLRQALGEALDQLQAELGPDVERWTWGRLNKVHFAHPLGSVKPLHLVFNRGLYPFAGDHDTLLRAAGIPQFPFGPVGVGDALRFIADLSDWEKCRIVLPGGQSGHAASRHYADLIPLWREGRFQPMPFGRDRVENYAEQRLVLEPK